MGVATRDGLLSGLLIGGAVAALAAGIMLQRKRYSFRNRVVLITGGSRGLGLVMARRLAAEGARLALLARREEELDRARQHLEGLGAEVLTVRCDLREREQIDDAVARAVAHFGRVDVLINNAGIIQVGPFEEMKAEDFEEAMAVHFFAPLYLTFAVLPHMGAHGGGRIVNISSLGGKIAVPHLLPYTASKFALAGFSDGLHVELRKRRVFVTTVCPGLIRTGSPRNAKFKGRPEDEYAWFSILGSLPLLSTNAERAARKIIEASRRGQARLMIGLHTKSAVVFHEAAPNLATRISSLANRWLLPGPGRANETRMGYESESGWTESGLTRLTRRAARNNNEISAPD